MESKREEGDRVDDHRGGGTDLGLSSGLPFPLVIYGRYPGRGHRDGFVLLFPFLT